MPSSAAITTEQRVSPSAAIGNIVAGLSLGEHLAGLSGRAVQVLLAVLARYNFKKHQAWPSNRDISVRTGLSIDTVQRAIADLEKAGLLVPVRVCGKVTRYTLPAWVREMAQANPWQKKVAANQPHSCGHHAHQPAAQLRPKQEEDPLEQLEDQQQSAQGDVVVSDASLTSDAPALLPLHLPTDLIELPAKRKGLSVATLRRLIGQCGADAVRGAVDAIEEQYPNGAGVRAYGAVLTTATLEGWTSKRLAEQALREEEERAYALAAPPNGTRWAIGKESGRVLEVLEVAADVVKTDRGVIPRANWPQWTWAASLPGKTTSQEDLEGGCLDDQVSLDPVNDKRSRLALVAASISVCRPAPEKLASLLARHGVTQAELDAYRDGRSLGC